MYCITMRIFPMIPLLLLFVMVSINCQQANTTNSTSNATTTNSTRPVGRRIGPATTSICESWDDSGLTDTGEDMCEEDFKYDKFGCLKGNDKLTRHQGKREFGQKCDSNGGEEACLLLAPSNHWRWKDFNEDSINIVVQDCVRRTNLVCHGYYNRCYCSTKNIPGDSFQYDKVQKVCVIRPGFPCVNEYDCANGTVCVQVYDEVRACTCDYRDSEADSLSIITTNWYNWYCGSSENKKPSKPERKIEFGFGSKGFKRAGNNATQVICNNVFQVLAATAMQMAFIKWQQWIK